MVLNGNGALDQSTEAANDEQKEASVPLTRERVLTRQTTAKSSTTTSAKVTMHQPARTAASSSGEERPISQAYLVKTLNEALSNQTTTLMALFKSEIHRVEERINQQEEWIKSLEERIEAVSQDLQDQQVRGAASDTGNSGSDEILKLSKIVESQRKEIRRLQDNTPEPSLFRQIREQFQRAEDGRRMCNVIVHGLDRKDNEKKQEVVQIANDFISNQLGVQVTVTEAFRLGKHAKSPLLIKLSSVKEKIIIFKNCNKLKGSRISVQEDVSEDTRHERRRQLDRFKELRSNGHKVYFRGPVLCMDGKPVPEEDQD